MICLFAVSASAQKMKPEDILAKHLDSIGTSSGSTGIEWIFNLTEFAVNQNLADGTFDIDAK